MTTYCFRSWGTHSDPRPSLHLPSSSASLLSSPSDQVRNSYYIGADGSLRLLLANGMEVALQTEPHLLAGTVNPTVGKRNVTLPIDNGLNLVEWRQRKEQARGQVTVFGRRLRVSGILQALIWRGGGGGGVYLETQIPSLKLPLKPQFPHLPKGDLRP